MGAGILMSRQQANAAMAAARSGASCDRCGNKGGVTGSTPATGVAPSRPFSRQDALHPRVSPAQIGRFRGDTPCSPSSTRNAAQRGYTGNGSRNPPTPDKFATGPQSAFQPSPFDNPSIYPAGQNAYAPNSNGAHPSDAALGRSPACPPCGTPTITPDSGTDMDREIACRNGCGADPWPTPIAQGE